MERDANRPREQICIRGLDPDLWKEVRVAAVRAGCAGSDILNGMIRRWLDERRAAADRTRAGAAPARAGVDGRGVPGEPLDVDRAAV